MSLIFWKGQLRSVDDLASAIEALRIPGMHMISGVLDDHGMPAVVIENDPPEGDSSIPSGSRHV